MDVLLHVQYNQVGHAQVYLELSQFVLDFVETGNGNLQTQNNVMMGIRLTGMVVQMPAWLNQPTIVLN